MTHRSMSISGSGSRFPFDDLASFVTDIDGRHDADGAVVTLKQWSSSGDSGGYGAVEAGWKITVDWDV